MKVLVPFATVGLLILGFASCSKNASHINSSVRNSTTIKIEDVKFRLPVTTLVAKHYDEFACITNDSLAGTKCLESVGKSCSTQHDCTAIPTLLRSGLLSKEEADHSIEIVKKAYGVQYSY